MKCEGNSVCLINDMSNIQSTGNWKSWMLSDKQKKLHF